MGHLYFSRIATGRKMGYAYQVDGTHGAIRFDGEDQNALWLYASGGQLARCELPLLGKDDEPANYRLVLHFAEQQKGAAPFSIRLQGETVARDIDVVAEAGINRPLKKEFAGVRVTGAMLIELIADPAAGRAPTVCALEVYRE